MVIVVLILNVLIALLCFYVAGRVWQLRSALARAADALAIAERYTRRVLSGAPDAILCRQQGVDQLHQQYQRVVLQLQQVERILALLGLGQVVWRWYAQRRSLEQIHAAFTENERRYNSPSPPLKRARIKKPKATYT